MCMYYNHVEIFVVVHVSRRASSILQFCQTSVVVVGGTEAAWIASITGHLDVAAPQSCSTEISLSVTATVERLNASRRHQSCM